MSPLTCRRPYSNESDNATGDDQQVLANHEQTQEIIRMLLSSSLVFRVLAGPSRVPPVTPGNSGRGRDRLLVPTKSELYAVVTVTVPAAEITQGQCM